jgi:hypothetical protein
MNKKIVFVASALMLFTGIANINAAPPGGGVNNFQTIDANTAQAYISNYKNNVQNKFAESYTLNLTPITNYVNSGASAVRLYNGLLGDGSKVAIMVPIDVNYNNMTGGGSMAYYGHGICPPDCDISSTTSYSSMATASAQTAVNNYNSNGSYDSYNSFIIYPAALNALRNVGAIYFHMYNAIITSSGQRCIIYQGVAASGAATYYIEDAGSMSSKSTM